MPHSKHITRQKETVAGRCLNPEFREGFVRGYTECANELLLLVEHMVSNESEVSEIRSRFVDYLHGVATMIDTDVLAHEDCEHREEDGPWQATP